ncbi:hypothetical protein Shal_3768 [Shewanella halifaxensis HAW-EB4]|uniref:Uncharacterized protein n=1 Tax=Shewanella halifaxensis (strain HAW-EB4) TaxID=458817 RepID=B0TV41_SHEHH|nr:hypothetical protein [Shewanella halifaxensis]ABZ78308.1 hypothetical protein Shal_3768 [Shewanella halifaxensis HAW-EB4]
MSDYFFVKENQPTPIYAVAEEYEEAAYSTRFTFPSAPIPVLAQHKPREEYEIPDVILEPALSISKRLFDSLQLEQMYGANWIPIKLIDQGEHDFMMMQLAHEVDVICHQQSVFKRFKRGYISGMKKLVIDPTKLAQIPLYKRLVFRDKSWGFHTFYHKDIVNQIMQHSPKGVEFVPIATFNESWAG